MIRFRRFSPYVAQLMVFFGVAVLISAPVRKRIPQSSTALEQTLSTLYMAIDPDMPGPLLYPEPEFTWGTENTVFWNRDSVQALIDSMNVTLIAFEVEARFNDTELWGFVDSDVDSARFQSLPEGVPVDYRLRYYARTAAGLFRMSRWSPDERSIQDQQPPTLHSWTIPDLQEPRRLDWITGNTVWNHVVASDSVYGKVMHIAVHEESEGISETTYYDIETPVVHIDTLVPYPLFSQANTLLELSVWVVDVAGKPSADTLSQTLFWWPFEEEPAPIICYPNPFRPSEGEISVIKVNAPGITRARVFDPFGELVAVLDKPLSRLFFEWDGRNQSGRAVARGGYVLVVDGHEDMYCKIAVY